jgi:hypothetical protein
MVDNLARLRISIDGAVRGNLPPDRETGAAATGARTIIMVGWCFAHGGAASTSAWQVAFLRCLYQRSCDCAERHRRVILCGFSLQRQ